MGYSLGANILLKWLGELGRESTDPDGLRAVAVSTPFTPAECSRAMLKGGPRIYGRYFTRRLLEAFSMKTKAFAQANKQTELASLEALQHVNTISNIWEFDDRITAPLHGFEHAEDYYNKCSSIHFLQDIKTDTLLIQSANDPMIPPAALPDPKKLPDSVAMELYRKGGHVGFIAGQGKPWLETRIADFIQA